MQRLTPDLITVTIEQVLVREDKRWAYLLVVRNQLAAGVDGMTVHNLKLFL